jgi:hypothetical protein
MIDKLPDSRATRPKCQSCLFAITVRHPHFEERIVGLETAGEHRFAGLVQVAGRDTSEPETQTETETETETDRETETESDSTAMTDSSPDAGEQICR